jgi:hypothetical protein
MLNEPAYGLGGEVDVYENAICIGKGVIPDTREEGVEDAYTAFIQRGNLSILGKPRKDLEATYERWLKTSGNRR